MATISINLDQGSRRHNNRDSRMSLKHTDSTRTKDNITYHDESIESAYHHLFDEAMEEYNDKIRKKHPDRVIKNYLDKIRSSRNGRSKQGQTGQKECYSIIAQCGNLEDKTSSAYGALIKSLDEYSRTFQERNPNFYVFNEVMHRDENGMDHTHIMFIPVAYDCKRGMKRQVSMRSALKEMGFGANKEAFKKWREREMDYIKSLYLKHDIQYDEPKYKFKHHMTTEEYKDYKQYQAKQEEIINDQCKKIQKQQETFSNLVSECTEIAQELVKRRLTNEKEKKVLDIQKAQIASYSRDMSLRERKLNDELVQFEEKKKKIDKKVKILNKIYDKLIDLYNKTISAFNSLVKQKEEVAKYFDVYDQVLFNTLKSDYDFKNDEAKYLIQSVQQQANEYISISDDELINDIKDISYEIDSIEEDYHLSR